MRVEEKKLVPVLCDLTEYDLGNNPLIAFNYVHLSREGIRKLAESINISLGDTKLPPDMLAKTFDVWWPEFDAATKDIIANPDKGAAKKAFSLEDSIEEILSILRSLARDKGTDFFDLWRSEILQSTVEKELLRNRLRDAILRGADEKFQVNFTRPPGDQSKSGPIVKDLKGRPKPQGDEDK